MRGKVLPFCQFYAPRRITPAYAGKSLRCRSCRRCYRDHPRLCGEKFSFSAYYPVLAGSPPPMRGKADVVQQAVSCIGITPAYAGKSEKGYDKFTEIGDHPRLCGEKRRRHFAHLRRSGSPPPMRGKAAFNASTMSYTRITPAYAGKSSRHSKRWL